MHTGRYYDDVHSKQESGAAAGQIFDFGAAAGYRDTKNAKNVSYRFVPFRASIFSIRSPKQMLGTFSLFFFLFFLPFFLARSPRRFRRRKLGTFAVVVARRRRRTSRRTSSSSIDRRRKLQIAILNTDYLRRRYLHIFCFFIK